MTNGSTGAGTRHQFAPHINVYFRSDYPCRYLFSQEIRVDYFGEQDSRNMPQHFFWECLHLDHDSAIRADISRQNYTVCPRHWYIDAAFRCSRCDETFCFTALEQKRWYEELGFYVDSYAKNCPNCRRNKRREKKLRQEYDLKIKTALESDDIQLKIRVSDVIDELCSYESELPDRIHENRNSLAKQIGKNAKLNDG